MPLKLVPPRPGKTPYYSVRGTYFGVYVDRSTKTAVKAQAAKFLTLWKEEIETGKFQRPSEPTFLDAAVNYMAATGQERFLEPIVEHFGKTPLRLITQQTIDDLAIRLYPKATPATRNRQVHTVVSAVLKQAGFETKLKRPSGWRGSKRVDWLWPEQAFRVFEAADEVDAEFGIFLRFLTYTGARLSEATQRFKIDGLSIPEAFAYFDKTKNDDPRSVHLPAVLTTALASHPAGLARPGRTVFRFRKNGRLYTLLNQVRAKVPDITITGFHMFRHTWATWMRRYGGLDTTGLLATQAWKDAASARRYEHVVVTEEARKAELLPVDTRIVIRK